MSQFVVLTELYEDSTTSLYTKLDDEGKSKTSYTSSGFSVRKVVINKNHVILLKEDTITNERHRDSGFDLGLSEMQEFTRVYISSSSRTTSYITVVGPLTLITEKLMHDDQSS